MDCVGAVGAYTLCLTNTSSFLDGARSCYKMRQGCIVPYRTVPYRPILLMFRVLADTDQHRSPTPITVQCNPEMRYGRQQRPDRSVKKPFHALWMGDWSCCGVMYTCACPQNSVGSISSHTPVLPCTHRPRDVRPCLIVDGKQDGAHQCEKLWKCGERQ